MLLIDTACIKFDFNRDKYAHKIKFLEHRARALLCADAPVNHWPLADLPGWGEERLETISPPLQIQEN